MGTVGVMRHPSPTPQTLHRLSAAVAIVDTCTGADPDWRYELEAIDGPWYAVAVYDEDNEKVGYL